MILKNVFSERGALSIEFAGYFFVFALLCAFLVDMNSSLGSMGDAGRLNNVLLNVLKNRNELYASKDKPIGDDDVKKLTVIADFFMKNSGDIAAPYQLGVREISFESGSIVGDPIVKDDKTYVSDKIKGCDILAHKSPLKYLSNLTVKGPIYVDGASVTGWKPVYEIILCVPGTVSLLDKVKGDLKSVYNINAGVLK